MKKISAVSKYIIHEMKKNNIDINHLKLQKLLYYIQVWNLVFLEKEIFEEDFEAWLHGPVARVIWDEYKEKSILMDNIELEEEEISLNVTEEQKEIIDDVLDSYGTKTGYHLEMLTHQEQPWITAYEKGRNTIISKTEMKEYYTEKFYGEKK